MLPTLALMKPASFISHWTAMVWSEPTGKGIYWDSMLILKVWPPLPQGVWVSWEVASVKSDPLFVWFFFKGNFPTRLRKHSACSGWLNAVSQEQHSGRWTAGRRSVLQRATSPWEWWQLEPAGESCCILRCEGKAWTVHMLYHTVLPAAAGSFIVAVNALFLSFSPLKIRKHSGLGCVRQRLPRMVGDGECGSDGSTHWGWWACVREPFKACG